MAALIAGAGLVAQAALDQHARLNLLGHINGLPIEAPSKRTKSDASIGVLSKTLGTIAAVVGTVRISIPLARAVMQTPRKTSVTALPIRSAAFAASAAASIVVISPVVSGAPALATAATASTTPFRLSSTPTIWRWTWLACANRGLPTARVETPFVAPHP